MCRETSERLHEGCLSSDCMYILGELAQLWRKRKLGKETVKVGKERKR